MTVVELRQFSKRAARTWSANDLDEFIAYIAENPEAGDVVPEAGGVRKVRWPAKGHGKQGGAWVIYFFPNKSMPLFLLDCYAKNEKSDLGTDDQTKLILFVQMIMSGR